MYIGKITRRKLKNRRNNLLAHQCDAAHENRALNFNTLQEKLCMIHGVMLTIPSRRMSSSKITRIWLKHLMFLIKIEF